MQFTEVLQLYCQVDISMTWLPIQRVAADSSHCELPPKAHNWDAKKEMLLFWQALRLRIIMQQMHDAFINMFKMPIKHFRR